jgi:nicotinate phosphoribosyltransferase
MLCDFYEFTMSNGYLKNGFQDKIAYFDLFFRKVPDGGGFAIAAGLEQAIDYVNSISFNKEDLTFLKNTQMFCQEFLDYLENFKFSCSMWAIPEGTPIFPHEPVITIRGPVIQAQLLETILLLSVNHQSLIATKANRIVRAAAGRPVLEFGSRRAQGADGAILGARAAYIAGCEGTACTICDRDYGVPSSGTMAHSWVQMFDTEEEAFRQYARLYPDKCVLLVDTYDVLKSGIPNAITVFKEEVIPRGFTPGGIRIDSGDITYLSKMAKKMLSEAGLEDCKIVASNSLDETIIRDMLQQGACVDIFGVGERLITSKSEPVFGGVYKLVGVENDAGEIIPKIKVSENVAKITTPHFKKLYRLYEKGSNKAIADVLTLHNETIDTTKPYKLFDPDYTWKTKTVRNYWVRDLMEPIYDNGKLVYHLPSIDEIRNYCKEQVNTLWDEVLRFENPHSYYVDLSLELWRVKERLLNQNRTF